MTVSAIGSDNNSYIASLQADLKKQAQDFTDLSSALQSGDLSSAQSAFTAFQQDITNMQQTSGGQQSGQNNQLTTDMSSLGSALQSGDLSGAQKAFSTLQQDMQKVRRGHHHHKEASLEADSTKTNSDSSDLLNGTGNASDTSDTSALNGQMKSIFDLLAAGKTDQAKTAWQNMTSSLSQNHTGSYGSGTNTAATSLLSVDA